MTSLDDDRGAGSWPVWAICLIAAVVSCALTLGELRQPAPPIDAGRFLVTSAFEPPEGSAEVLLARGDGQLFATHALDPFLRHPERIRGGPGEQAYRFQRPLYGWVGWVASIGKPALVPWAMVLLTIASVVALVAVLAVVIAARGGDARLSLCVLASAGVIADLLRVGPEALGTALVVLGACAWTGFGVRRSTGVALVLMSAAVLSRESFVLVPVALALHEARRGRWAIRSALPLAVTVVPYALWVLVLRVHLGSWPVGYDGASERVSLVPFSGLVDALPVWGVLDVALLGLLTALAVAAVLGSSVAWLRWCIVAFVPLIAVAGVGVWQSWIDVGRPLLPVFALSLLALAEHTQVKAHAAPCRVSDAGGLG